MSRTAVIALFLASLLLNLLVDYGGVRSPDSEIVMRTAESLARRGDFAVKGELTVWPGFGLATGVDGRDYAIFGPLQSLAAAPLVLLADAVGERGPFRDDAGPLPVSHYVDGASPDHARATPPELRRAYGTRLVVSLLNALVTALGAALFLHLALLLCGSPAAALALAALYAFGSPAWPYAGTFFSEALTALLTLASLAALLRPRPRPAAAGLLLGLATAGHVTALLFTPPWLLLAAGSGPRALRDLRGAVRAGGAFLAGLAAVGALLGLFNFLRFGDVFETGRSIGESSLWTTKYAHPVAPWRPLVDLLFSGGKGLLWFCPALLLGLLGWRRLHRRRPLLSWTLIATALIRLVFIATRSDWHGGFALGPRYLVVLVPFLLLPAAPLLADVLKARRRPAVLGLAAFGAACVAQQLYFCLGEVFAFLQRTRFEQARLGVDVLLDDRLYRDWSLSPLTGLLDGPRGPWLLQGVAASNATLWWAGTAAVAAMAVGWALWWTRRAAKASYGRDGR